jgi:hypothetical protein
MPQKSMLGIGYGVRSSVFAVGMARQIGGKLSSHGHLQGGRALGEPPNVLSNNISTMCCTASMRERQPQSRPSKVLTPCTAALSSGLLSQPRAPFPSRASGFHKELCNFVRDAPDGEASRSANAAKAEIAAEQTLSFRSVIRETMMTNPKDLLTSLENALNDNDCSHLSMVHVLVCLLDCGARIRSVDQADCALSKRPPVQQGQNSR